MKQIVQTQTEGKIRVEEVPLPLLRPGGVLVRTAWSLVSAGTEKAKVELAQKSLMGKARAKPEQVRQVLDSVRDLGIGGTYRKVTNRLEALQALGYSAAGIVVGVGEGIDDLVPGDGVACAGAGYANHAEYVFVPRNLCARIPASMLGPSSTGLRDAAFATVGAIALHGVRQADLRLGESVAVIGLGLVGLLAVQLFRAAGCRVVGMDFDERRCAVAASLGCARTASDRERFIAEVHAFTGGVGVDATALTAATSSSEPVELAGRICRDRGRVVVVGSVGMDVPRALFYDKELDLRISRSYGPGRYDPEYEEKGRDYPIGYVRWTERRNLETFLSLVSDGALQLTPLITHTFPIENAGDAYNLITKGSEPYIGVMIRYPTQESETSMVPPQTRVVVGPGTEGSGIAVGLIGCGNFAQDTLLPALRADSRFRLRGVASASGLTARSVAERFRFEYAASNAEELIDDSGVTAVVIATRHDAHAPLLMRALKAGKHVFVEKPLVVNQRQLRGVIEAYGAAERLPVLMVGFNRRFAPGVQVIKDFFAGCAEPLSMHLRVNAGFLPSSHWLHDEGTGGGRIVGEGCHFVDLMRYLAGAPIQEVYAYALPDLGRYNQDNVIAHIRFENGSSGVLQYLANGDKRLAKERLEIFGAGAVAVLDDFREVELVRAGRVKRVRGFVGGKDKGHNSEIKAFADAVAGACPPPIPFEEIVNTTAATFAIRESIRTGQVISVDGASSARAVLCEEISSGK